MTHTHADVACPHRGWGVGALGRCLRGSPESLQPPEAAVPWRKDSKVEVKSRGKRRGSAATSGSSTFLEVERKCLLTPCPAGQQSSRLWLLASARDWMSLDMQGYSGVGRSIAFPASGCEPACL